MEKEVDGKLPFLDVLVAKQTGTTFETSMYHKRTYTGLLTNFFQFHCILVQKRINKNCYRQDI